jgi:hypothetical protein
VNREFIQYTLKLDLPPGVQRGLEGAWNAAITVSWWDGFRTGFGVAIAIGVGLLILSSWRAKQ